MPAYLCDYPNPDGTACSLVCQSKQDLKRHMASAHRIGVEAHYCLVVNCPRNMKPFERKGGLARHLKNTHGPGGGFVCDLADEDGVPCGKRCNTAADLQSHKNIFHKLGPLLECPTCMYDTRAPASLRDHINHPDRCKLHAPRV